MAKVTKRAGQWTAMDGHALIPRDIERLAEEAEAGYDLSRAGREQLKRPGSEPGDELGHPAAEGRRGPRATTRLRNSQTEFTLDIFPGDTFSPRKLLFSLVDAAPFLFGQVLGFI